MLQQFNTKIGSLALIPSSGGVFEVTLDGDLLFSKKELKRFPEEKEVEEKVEATLA